MKIFHPCFLALPAAMLMAASTATAQSLQTKGLTGYAAEAAAASQNLTQRTDTWGDWYGTAPSTDMPTTVRNYYYDNQNRLTCTILLTNLAGDSESTLEVEKEGDQYPNELIRYYYDEQGNMVQATKRAFGMYNIGYMSWKSTTEVEENNAYNADGHIVWYNKPGTRSRSYVWDGDNLVERNDTTGYGNWTQNYVYTDFLEGFTNCPQTVYTISRWGQKYKGVYEYDAQGRPVKYTETSINAATVDDNHHMTDIELADVPYSQTTWEYDENGLSTSILSYWNNGKATFVPSEKEAETLRSDGGVETTQYNYSNSSSSWAKNGSPTVDYSGTYTENTAPTALSVEFVDEATNEIRLTADAPADLKGDEIWKVYRNAQYAGRATLEEGKIVYTESQTANGDWVYFIQRATEADTTGVNATDLLDVTLAAPVPAPRDLHIASSSVSGKEYTYKMQWTSPEASSQELRGYYVYSDLSYFASNPTPLNDELLTDTTYTITWDIDDAGTNHTFYVEAVYDLGRSGLGQPVAVMLGQEAQRFITTKKTMGDSMGTLDDDVASKILTYYYDGNNRLVRTALAERLSGDNPQTPDVVEKAGDYQVTEYDMYNYGANGNLIELLKAEYSVNQGANMSWTVPDTLETYTYDENNHCLSLEGDGRKYEYAWDGDNKVEEKQYSTGTGNLLYTLTYSDFVEGKTNLPQKGIKYGTSTSNQRIYEYAYDAAGNKISAYTYKYGEVERDDDGNITSATNGDPEYRETWTYDENGFLTLYLKEKWNTSNQIWLGSSKTEYTQTVDGESQISYANYSNPEKWTKSGRPYVNTYMDYYKNTTPTNFTVSKVEDELNTVAIKASVPTERWDNPSYYVYRNGEKIGKAEVNALNTTITYTDATVQNGTWDYFLIADTDARNVATSVTTPVTMKFDTELQPVTEVWSTDASAGETYYNLSVAWKAPVSDIPLLGYNVYSDIKSYTKNPAPDNDVNLITGTTYDFSWSTEGEPTKEVYVEAVYNIGRIRSQMFSFNVSEISAISQTSQDAESAKLTLNGRQLSISGTYETLNVFDLKGVSCGTWTGAKNINLRSLSAGVYVVKVNTANGKSNAYKLVVK